MTTSWSGCPSRVPQHRRVIQGPDMAGGRSQAVYNAPLLPRTHPRNDRLSRKREEEEEAKVLGGPGDHGGGIEADLSTYPEAGTPSGTVKVPATETRTNGPRSSIKAVAKRTNKAQTVQ